MGEGTIYLGERAVGKELGKELDTAAAAVAASKIAAAIAAAAAATTTGILLRASNASSLPIDGTLITIDSPVSRCLLQPPSSVN